MQPVITLLKCGLIVVLSVLLGACGTGGGDSDGTDEFVTGSAPEVRASWSGEAFAGLTVELDASAEDDGVIVDWLWEQTGGPEI